MTDRGSGREPVEQLVELARSAREDTLAHVLEAVADAVVATTPFTSLALNVYRPAWHDYEVVLDRGGAAVDHPLLGTRMPAEALPRVVGGQSPRLPGTYLLDAASTGWSAIENVYRPDIPYSEDPDAWRAGDGVIVVLTDTRGAPLGFVSADEPRHGRRPTDDELRLLRAICSHAEQALETARAQEATATAARRSARLLTTSRLIAACTSESELMELVCDTIIQHLGFERVALYTRHHTGALELLLTRGWESSAWLAPHFSTAELVAVLTPDRERAGSWLVPAHELFPAAEPTGTTTRRSRRNGRGAQGWNDGCLLVPLRGRAEDIVGALVVEDPADHRLPSDHVRELIRLLADQAATAWMSLRMQQIQLRLLDLVLVRKGAQALAEALAETIGAPVALLDWSGEPIAQAMHETRRIAIPRLPLAEGSELLVRALEIGDQAEGYLLVERSAQTDPVREMAVEQAVTSFSLQLAMLNNAEEVEHRTRGTLIDELLDSPTASTDVIARRAQRLGHDLDALSIAIAIAPLAPRDDPDPVTHQSDVTHLARAVRAAIDASGCRALIAPRGTTLLALIDLRGTVDPRQLADQLIRHAERRTGLRIAVGVSRAATTPARLAPAIREAQNALRAARALRQLGGVALTDELPLRHLLLSAPRTEEMHRAAYRLLAPLLRDDARATNANLMNTLAAYLESVGNLQAAAHAVGIHINTLRYRIGRIEELLGVQLRDAQTRIELQLAYEVLAADTRPDPADPS